MSELPQPEVEGSGNLARSSDSEGIATLLNRKLQARGITVAVSWQQGGLEIALEGEDSPPDEGELVAFISEAIAKFKVDPIEAIEVCGRIRGETQPAWVHRIEWDNGDVRQALADWLNASAKIAPLSFNEETERGADERQDFLRFRLAAAETALLPLHCIKEVLNLSLTEVLPVPQMSDRILGIYHWRGEMLWLIDLNRLLGFPAFVARDLNEQASAIVLQFRAQTLGLVVQQVEDIERLRLEDLQPASSRLFSPQLLPFVSGYLAGSIVLDPGAISVPERYASV